MKRFKTLENLWPSLGCQPFSPSGLLLEAEVKTMRPGDGKSFPKEGDQIVMYLGSASQF